MRLLEFSKDEGGANPRPATAQSQPIKKTPARAAPPKPTPPPTSQTTLKPYTNPGRVFPVPGNTALRKPARHSPVDLEQLQQRVDFLERRLQHPAGLPDERASVRELERLKQRLQRLEHNLDNELWAAKQREHTMLELLSRPPLKVRIRQRLLRFWHTERHDIHAWLKHASHIWWQDSQPGWWPRFYRAWQEALDKARS